MCSGSLELSNHLTCSFQTSFVLPESALDVLMNFDHRSGFVLWCRDLF